MTKKNNEKKGIPFRILIQGFPELYTQEDFHKEFTKKIEASAHHYTPLNVGSVVDEKYILATTDNLEEIKNNVIKAVISVFSNAIELNNRISEIERAKK